MGVCPSEFMCTMYVQVPIDARRCSDALDLEFLGICHLAYQAYQNAGNSTQVLCKSSMGSSLLSHLS